MTIPLAEEEKIMEDTERNEEGEVTVQRRSQYAEKFAMFEKRDASKEIDKLISGASS